MKKNILFSLFAAIALFSVGCLKDDDFDNNKYGLNVSNTSTIAFPEAGAPLGSRTRGILPVASASIVDGPYLTLEGVGTLPSDVTVNLAFDNSIVTAAGLTPLPDGTYSLSTTTPVIKAGSNRLSDVKISITGGDALELGVTYGIGVRITGVSGGYNLSANQSTMVRAIVVKNAYEGEYDVVGYFYHPTASRDLEEEKELATVNVNTVQMGLGDLGASGYVMNVSINPDNSLTIVSAPGAAGGPYFQFDTGLPTSNPGYTGKWSGSASCNNTYDPATKTYYIRIGYLGGTGYRVSEEIVTLK